MRYSIRTGRLVAGDLENGELGVFRRILADAILIAFASILLAQFLLIWAYDWILVGEPNLVIRALETVMCIGIIALGFICLRGDMKSCRARVDMSLRKNNGEDRD